MKRIITGLLFSGLFVGLGVQALNADDKEDTERLKQPVERVNDSAKRAGVGQALHGISVETGVPKEAVEALHKRYADEKIANVMIACVLADQTKKAPEDFMKRHKDGKSWPDLAHENRVPVGLIAERLDRLDTHLSHPDKEREREVRRK
jgi:hypothetical protein